MLHQAMQDAGAGFVVCNKAHPPTSPASAAKHAVQHEMKTGAASTEAPAEDKGMSLRHHNNMSPLQNRSKRSSIINAFHTPRHSMPAHSAPAAVHCYACQHLVLLCARHWLTAAACCLGLAAPCRCAHRGQRQQCATHAMPAMLQMAAAAGSAAHYRHFA